ncbi:alpha-2-macroglobulin-like isoform X2 [Branchiostoma lanceolatum]|uniref:alpha-2-macroglobulin-like isoform X2 n=1 Tax=Branchiostoma lanceolatum TaxID=7740 RepID=UPI003453677A
MKVAVFTVLSLLVASAAAQRYLVVSPKVLLAGTEEVVCISLFDIEDDVKVSVEVASKSKDGDDFEPATVTDVLKGGQDKCVRIKVPHVSSDKVAKLSVYGKGSSYDFKDEKSVKISKKATSTFISTDKPIYKPGQKVQMRILTVKQDLRPYTENIDMVWLEDNSGSRINQWLDVPTEEGLASLEQQLSKEPVLGKWSINAQIADTTYKTTFDVEEYVLPKFEVEISPPPWIPVDMEVIPAVICGKYTYGKPVLGEVKAEFCIKQSYSYRDRRPCHTWTGKTDKNGCVNIAFDASLVELDSTRHSIWSATLRVKAEITEDGTGVKLNGSHDTTKIVRENQKLDLRKFSSEGFKPGLPYHGKLYVTDILDNPLADVKVTIAADMTRKNNMYSSQEYSQNYTSNQYGEIPFTLPTYMTNRNVKRLNLNAKLADIPPSKYERGTYQMDNPSAFLSVRSWWSPSSSFLQIQPIHDILPCDSVAEVSILYKTERVSKTKFHYKIMSRGDILDIGTKEVAFESAEEPSTYQPPTTAPPPTTPFTGSTTTEEPIPEDELIDLPPVEIVVAQELFGGPPPPPPPPPGPRPGPDAPPPPPDAPPASSEEEDSNDGEVRRKRSSPPYRPPFYRPDIDETPDMPPIPGYTGELTIKFKVVPSLSPLVRLLVYYVREDGEVVADSSSIKIASCLENNVSVSFPKESQLPGATTKLTVKASPGSLCSVGVVDKSVHLMRSSNQLTQGKVFAELNRLDLSEEGGYVDMNTHCDRDEPAIDPIPPVMEPLPPPPPPRVEVPLPPRVEFPAPVPAMAVEEVEVPPAEFPTESDSNESEEVEEVEEEDEDEEERSINKRSVYFPGYASSSYEDAYTAFKAMGLLVMTDLLLQTRPCALEFLTVAYSVSVVQDQLEEFDVLGAPGPAPPVVAFAAPAGIAPAPAPAPAPAAKSASQEKVIEVRNYFPETWMWETARVSDNGLAVIDTKVPHTITEWIGSGFCTSSTSGVGVSLATSLTAFQPFFVSTTLPYSVIRGEEVPLKVSIFNYMKQCQVIELTLLKSEDFDLIDKERTRQVCVCPVMSKTETFNIIPSTLGKINISVEAQAVEDDELVCGNAPVVKPTEGARDAIVKSLLVEPEGIEQEYTYSSFFCPKDFPNELLEDTIQTVLPENLVEGSNRAYLSVIGDLMGPTLSGLDNLVRQPTGCGEQNMVLFAPNIFVMQYLNTTKQLSSEIKDKSLEYMKIGYQRELTYKHKDGSYSAFGESDDSGSTWLSAFVFRCFAQARPYIFIDQKELDHTKAWFASNQKPDGCYQSVGKVLHKAMKGGVNDDTTLTAYIVIAMLESGESVESELVGNALECLLSSGNNVTSTYGIALMSYALTLANHPQREEYMEKLENLAVEKDGTVHWEREVQPGKPTEASDTWFRPYHKSPSAEVEMTSYALLAYMATGEREALVKGLPIVRWLTQQRNAYGGFSSTQDTVMALQALARYAEMAYGEGVDIEVQVQTAEGLDKTFTITDTNSLVLQRVEVPVTPTDISVRATGKGCALLQANVRYNIEEEEPVPSFEVNIKMLDVPELLRDEGGESSPCSVKMMSICTRFVDDEPSNMAVVAVKMVSGFIPDKTSLKTLKKEKTIKKYEIDGKMVNLYFDELTNEMTCFEFMVEQNIKVKNTKPGVVTVYDYYEEDLKISKKYNIDCSPPPPPPPPEEVPELLPFIPVGEPLFPDSVPTERQGCPSCLLKKEDISKVFCGSKYAYRMKTNRGKDGHEARIAEDLKDVNSTAPHHTVFIDMGTDCQCSELEVDAQVLVMGDRAPVAAETTKHHKLILDEYMTIMPWVHSHKAVQHALTKCKQGSEVNP